MVSLLALLLAAGTPPHHAAPARPAPAHPTAAPQGPVTRANLRLLVRSTAWCDSARRAMAARHKLAVSRPAPAGLCAMLVADFPTSMRVAAATDLATLGITEEEAWPLAEQQTLARLPSPVGFDFQRGAVVISDLDYIPSLILYAASWRSLARAQGDLLLAVPTDRTMMIVRAADVQDVPRLKAQVAQAYTAAGAQGISPSLYHWTSAGWAPLP